MNASGSMVELHPKERKRSSFPQRLAGLVLPPSSLSLPDSDPCRPPLHSCKPSRLPLPLLTPLPPARPPPAGTPRAAAAPPPRRRRPGRPPPARARRSDSSRRHGAAARREEGRRPRRGRCARARRLTPSSPLPLPSLRPCAPPVVCASARARARSDLRSPGPGSGAIQPGPIAAPFTIAAG